MRRVVLGTWCLAVLCAAWACSSGGGSTGFGTGASAGSGAQAGKAGGANGGSDNDGSASGGSANGGSAAGGSANGGSGWGDGSVPDVEFTYDATTSGKEEACAATTVKGKLTPLDLYFMLDTSGSMSGTNISALKTGVTGFANDPQAAGIFVSGQHFPIGGFSESCNPSDYANPAVAWNTLPYPAFNSWVNGLPATGYTPSVPALQGAVNACKARLTSEPLHKCVVVFVTDGNPEGNCPPTGSSAQAPLGAIASDAYNNFGIPVFAIGFPGLPSLGINIINHVAQQGGTGTAFIIQSGNIGAQFTQALQNIQQTQLGCEYLMPVTDAGIIDPNKVEVLFTPTGGQPQTLPRVNDASQCGPNGGWYYDNNQAPTVIRLCPETCNVIKADPTGTVDINLGCLGS